MRRWLRWSASRIGPRGRGQAPAQPAVKVAATELGVPVLQPETLRPPEAAEALAALAADLFVVVAYGRILPQRLLDLPRLGAWNVHASLLPRLRGAAPIQWSLFVATPKRVCRSCAWRPASIPGRWRRRARWR